MTTWTVYTGDPAKDVPTLSTSAPPTQVGRQGAHRFPKLNPFEE
jgi:hypothetical protein